MWDGLIDGFQDCWFRCKGDGRNSRNELDEQVQRAILWPNSMNKFNERIQWTYSKNRINEHIQWADSRSSEQCKDLSESAEPIKIDSNWFRVSAVVRMNISVISSAIYDTHTICICKLQSIFKQTYFVARSNAVTFDRSCSWWWFSRSILGQISPFKNGQTSKISGLNFSNTMLKQIHYRIHHFVGNKLISKSESSSILNQFWLFSSVFLYF